MNLSDLKDKGDSFVERNKECAIKVRFDWHVVIANELFGDCKPMVKEGGTKALSSYYRVIVDRFFPEDVEYALYLDIDMLVLGDVRELFDNHKLESKLLGAVIDLGAKNNDTLQDRTDPFIYGISKDGSSEQVKTPKQTYFNSGLMLVNLREWRKQDIGRQCLDAAAKFKFNYHDQALLNYVCEKQVEFIDLAWNLQNPMFYALYNKDSGKYDITSSVTPDVHWQCNTPNAEDFEYSLAHPKIIHFTGLKPWQTGSLRCGLAIGPAIAPCPKLSFYREQWIAVSQKVKEFNTYHFLNAEAVSLSTIELLKINDKRRKDRKLLTYLVSLSLVLNVITLTLLLLD